MRLAGPDHHKRDVCWERLRSPAWVLVYVVMSFSKIGITEYSLETLSLGASRCYYSMIFWGSLIHSLA
jgi:hypothetical protein